MYMEPVPLSVMQLDVRAAVRPEPFLLFISAPCMQSTVTGGADTLWKSSCSVILIYDCYTNYTSIP